MTLISFVFTFVILLSVGRALLSRAGWPTSSEAVLRWLVALLLLAVLASALPGFIAQLLASVSFMVPQISLTDLLAPLLVSGLAVVGYVGWSRGEIERLREADRDSRSLDQHRERLLPPAPGTEDGQEFSVDLEDASGTKNDQPIFLPRSRNTTRNANRRTS